MLAVVVVTRTHRKPFWKFIQILVKKRDSHRPHRKTFRFPNPAILPPRTVHISRIHYLPNKTNTNTMLIAFTVCHRYIKAQCRKEFFVIAYIALMRCLRFNLNTMYKQNRERERKTQSFFSDWVRFLFEYVAYVFSFNLNFGCWKMTMKCWVFRFSCFPFTLAKWRNRTRTKITIETMAGHFCREKWYTVKRKLKLLRNHIEYHSWESVRHFHLKKKITKILFTIIAWTIPRSRHTRACMWQREDRNENESFWWQRVT